MSPYAAILSTLVLFETFTLPCGPVRRSSLFGFELAGEVLELDEAAARVDAWRPPPAPAGRAGLVRLSPPVELLDTPAPLEEPTEDGEQHVRGLEVAVDDAPTTLESALLASLLRTIVAASSAGANVTPPPSSGVTARGDAVDSGPAFDPELDSEPQPHAIARPCVACNGGNRRRRHGCDRCHNRGVRVWIGDTEIGRAPPRTDAERRSVVRALAEVLPELPETAQRGVQDLFNVTMAAADPDTRDFGIREMRFAMECMRSS